MSTPNNNDQANYIRTYWAALVTDFLVGVKVAVDEGEDVPDWVQHFYATSKDFVMQNNSQQFLDIKFKNHRGEGGRDGKPTGIKAWRAAVNRTTANANPANVL